MRHLTFAFVMAATPVAAEEERGFSLMEEGAKLFFEGLMTEVEPAIEDLQGFMQDLAPELRGCVDLMGPALADLMKQVDDLTLYEAPEILPNGDIIIRRKQDAPAFEAPQGAIEL